MVSPPGRGQAAEPRSRQLTAQPSQSAPLLECLFSQADKSGSRDLNLRCRGGRRRVSEATFLFPRKIQALELNFGCCLPVSWLKNRHKPPKHDVWL